MHIAIDGPSGAGKSTVAKALAKEMNCIYLDTGAMYRTVGLLAVRKGVDTHDDAALAQMLKSAKIEVRLLPEGQHMMLNGEDVEGLIRNEKIGMAASDVAVCPSVRKILVDIQRGIAAENDVVMDGRDIGTHVLPNAEYKFFLTASPEVRAKRRYDQLIANGQEADYNKVLEDVIKRDDQDIHRKESPLQVAEDAMEINTDGLSIEETVSLLMAMTGQMLG